MVLLRRFDTPQLYHRGYVSIGNFDGVHSGHRRIVEQLANRARGDGVPAVVLTFDPHPLLLLRPEYVPPVLTTLEQKAALLEQAGATCVIAYPTDRKLLERTPEEFFDAIVVAELRAKGIIEGPNFCFGKDRKGDIETLHDLCQSRGVSLDVVEPVGGADRMVSSSTIRSLIESGRMAEAVKLLGHPYQLRGDIVTGARRGRSIGFPTANLARIETLLPADGVYAGTATIEGHEFGAAINVGPNPTFQENTRKVEAHLLDFSGDLYGHSLEVCVFQRLRDTRPFTSREELVQQITADVTAVRKAVLLHSQQRT